MATYRVEIRRGAEKEIRALPVSVRQRVVTRIAALADDPRPPGSRKLAGSEAYRVRQGAYRIVYTIDDGRVVVVVVRVAHRSDVYRR